MARDLNTGQRHIFTSDYPFVGYHVKSMQQLPNSIDTYSDVQFLSCGYGCPQCHGAAPTSNGVLLLYGAEGAGQTAAGR